VGACEGERERGSEKRERASNGGGEEGRRGGQAYDKVRIIMILANSSIETLPADEEGGVVCRVGKAAGRRE
jgi:hypothetical protein